MDWTVQRAVIRQTRPWTQAAKANLQMGGERHEMDSVASLEEGFGASLVDVNRAYEDADCGRPNRVELSRRSTTSSSSARRLALQLQRLEEERKLEEKYLARMEFLTRKYDLLVKAAASKGRSVRSGSSNETARAQPREVAQNSAAGEINARRGYELCCGSVEQDCGVDDLAISLKSVATSVPEEAAAVAYDDSVRDVEGADSDVVVVRVHSTPASVAKESLAVIQVTPEAVIEVDGFSLNAADVGGSTDEDSVIRAHSMTRCVAREELRNVLREAEEDVEDLTSPVARDGVPPEVEVGGDDFASLVAREGGMSEAEIGVADKLGVRAQSTPSATEEEIWVSSEAGGSDEGRNSSPLAELDDLPEGEVSVADDLRGSVHSASTMVAREHSAGFRLHEWETYDERSHHTNAIWEQQHLQKVDRRCDNEREQGMDLLQMEERDHQVVEEQIDKIRELAEVSRIHLSGGSTSYDWSREVSERISEKTTKRKVDENQSGRILDIHWNLGADAFLFEVDVLRLSVEGEGDVFEAETLRIVPLNDPAELMLVFVVYRASLVQDGQRANVKWDDNISSRMYDRGRQCHDVLREMGSEKILRCSLCTYFHITVRRTIGGKQLDRSSIAFERMMRDVKVVADKDVHRRVGDLEIEKECTMESGKSVPWGADARAINGSVRRIRAIVSLGNVEEMVTPELKLPETQGGVLRRITSPNALATLSGLFRRSTSF